MAAEACQDGSRKRCRKLATMAAELAPMAAELATMVVDLFTIVAELAMMAAELATLVDQKQMTLSGRLIDAAENTAESSRKR